MLFQKYQHQFFSKEIRSPKTDARITFSEYMVLLYDQTECEIKEKLEQRKEKYSKSGLDIEIYITIGKPTDKILEYSTDRKADLVVIGSIGITEVSIF